MRKWSVCISLLLCALLLTACAQEASPAPTEPAAAEATVTATEPPAEPATVPPHPTPDDITWTSALEPAPEAPEGFAIAPVLEYLCSTAFGGRQTGTDGCAKAGAYIAAFLEQWGYQPLFGESLAVPYTGVVGDPALAEAEVILHFPGGDLTLVEGVDYTFSFHLEDLDVTLPIATDPSACENGEAVFLGALGQSRGRAKITMRQCSGPLNPPSDVMGNGNTRLEDRRILLSESAFAAAEQATHVTLRMNASAREMERDNLCAVLPGADRTRAMVLCGHFDGTGTWGEILYPSAHDNASGTVTLLECARQLAGEALPFDLVICAFSGEEQHLLGSEALAPVLENHYELLNVINLDCLGCGVEDSLNLLAEEGAPFGEALIPYLQEAGYTTMIYNNATSDQASFTHPAIGFCELPEGYRFHCPHDTVDTVDPQWLQRVADAVCAYVLENDLLPIEARGW